MNARDLTALIHLVGFTTGVVLYSMLGVMTRRRLAYVVSPMDVSAVDRLPLAAALLGVIWNVGAMLVYAVRDFGIAHPLPWVAALSYSALGFLPAVVIHSTMQRSGRAGPIYLGVSYGASTVAALLNLHAALDGDAYSSIALLLLTIAYAALLAVLAVTERRKPGFQRSLTAVALAAFAVSALHLSRHSAGPDQDPWLVELVGHHASLPLVLAILYQEHRFAFADLFLKRALSLLALVALVALLYAGLVAPLVDPHALAARRALDDASHLIIIGSLLGLWIATALVYPFIQRRVYGFVDRTLLGRANYRDLRQTLTQRLGQASNAEMALDVTCELLARAVGANVADWSALEGHGPSGHPLITVDARRTAARITIPTTLDPSYEIRLADFSAGRTLLSDDLMLIDAVASLVGRRIDECRVDADRRALEQREEEMRRLTAEAELRALRAQLNPHFLFNALTTLGHLMQAAPDRALATLYQLTGLLRAVLRRTNGQFVSLREELDIVQSYLAIERERFQERLAVSIDVAPDLECSRIPPLLLQPLVENAVKHGIGPLKAGGQVRVRAWREGTGEALGALRLEVADTGIGAPPRADGRYDGVGLANLESRLHHYFGPTAAMSIRETPGGGTTVELCVPWLGPETPVST